MMLAHPYSTAPSQALPAPLHPQPQGQWPRLTPGKLHSCLTRHRARIDDRHRVSAIAFGGAYDRVRSLDAELDELESSPDSEAGPHNSKLLSLEEVQQIAASRGLHLVVRTLGPFYRITIRDGDAEGPVLAVSSGFTVPAMGLMHCDSLQIFTRGKRGHEGERVRGGALGLGLLIGGAVFSYGHSSGCKKAEILAIKDDDAWHKRLVRYYSFFGFDRVRAVGDSGLRDIPDLLVWGGVGMRMDADIEQLLARWTGAIRRSVPKGVDEESSHATFPST